MQVSIVVVVLFAAVTVYADTPEEAWQTSQVVPVGARIFALKHLKQVTGLQKIIGGHKVDVSNYPYQLSVRSYDNHICGASVISAHWALTAAHCVFPQRVLSTISLRAGSTDRLFGGRIHNVSRIVIHPQYNPANFDNDVAVLRVAIPFTASHVRPIQLVPEGYEPVTGIRSLVTGWGRTLDQQELPSELYAVDIPVVDRSECAKYWGSELVTNNMICAGQKGRDSCNGDSGSPLVSGGRQIGLVSWGSTDCGGPMPGVYTHLGRTGVRKFISIVTGV